MVWRLIGSWVTRPHLRAWLAASNWRILNLGGGGVLSGRWLTADVDPRSDVYMDITKRLPLPEGSIDVIYMEEVIEHVTLQEGKALLDECLRVLKPGGRLRVTTPSLNVLARRALKDEAYVPELNKMFYEHGHRYIYSEEQLRACFLDAGFAEITASTYRDDRSPLGCLDSHHARFPWTQPETSQYWDATKSKKKEFTSEILTAGQA